MTLLSSEVLMETVSVGSWWSLLIFCAKCCSDTPALHFVKDRRNFGPVRSGRGCPNLRQTRLSVSLWKSSAARILIKCSLAVFLSLCLCRLSGGRGGEGGEAGWGTWCRPVLGTGRRMTLLFQEVYSPRSDDSQNRWYGSSAQPCQNRSSNIYTRQTRRSTAFRSVLMKSYSEPARWVKAFTSTYFLGFAASGSE